MIRWSIGRTGEALLLTIAGSIVLVTLVHLLPGDPVAAIVGERVLDPAVEANLRARWGFDRSLGEQLAAFLGGAARGDLGLSIVHERPVTTLLAERLPATLLLGGLTLLINFTVGLGIGLWSALRPRTILARAIGFVTLATYTVPSFVIGLVLVWLFAVEWQLLPAGGAIDPLLAPDAGWWAVTVDRARPGHPVRPPASVVLATPALPIRHQISAATATLHAGWVTAARARGVAPWRIAWRHVWRPALTPIITLLGLWLPMLVSGAVFVEAVFAWPGLGALIAEATAGRDIPVVIGAGVLLGAAVQGGSRLADPL
mgnify:CR=1 FL=1